MKNKEVYNLKDLEPTFNMVYDESSGYTLRLFIKHKSTGTLIFRDGLWIPFWLVGDKLDQYVLRMAGGLLWSAYDWLERDYEE